jgi:hypothetical protein
MSRRSETDGGTAEGEQGRTLQKIGKRAAVLRQSCTRRQTRCCRCRNRCRSALSLPQHCEAGAFSCTCAFFKFVKFSGLTYVASCKCTCQEDPHWGGYVHQRDPGAVPPGARTNNIDASYNSFSTPVQDIDQKTHPKTLGAELLKSCSVIFVRGLCTAASKALLSGVLAGTSFVLQLVSSRHEEWVSPSEVRADECRMMRTHAWQNTICKKQRSVNRIVIVHQFSQSRCSTRRVHYVCRRQTLQAHSRTF